MSSSKSTASAGSPTYFPYLMNFINSLAYAISCIGAEAADSAPLGVQAGAAFRRNSRALHCVRYGGGPTNLRESFRRRRLRLRRLCDRRRRGGRCAPASLGFSRAAGNGRQWWPARGVLVRHLARTTE